MKYTVKSEILGNPESEYGHSNRPGIAVQREAPSGGMSGSNAPGFLGGLLLDWTFR